MTVFLKIVVVVATAAVASFFLGGGGGVCFERQTDSQRQRDTHRENFNGHCC